VPGSVLGGRNRGAHALIRDGAKIVEGADDIVDELGWTDSATRSDSKGTSGCQSTTSRDPVLSRMQPGQAYDLDGLADATGINGVRLLPRLLELELHGNVQRVEGGRFMRRI
jgi:DNA processing protein